MERLLVAQTGFLGDVILTTPLLSTLRRELDLESLTVLTTPRHGHWSRITPQWTAFLWIANVRTTEDFSVCCGPPAGSDANGLR